MLLVGLLFLATRSSGYTVLPRQDVGSPAGIPAPFPQNASDMCSTCPEMRSLVSILWSCFSTLVLATWVSVHPNVPPPRTTFFRMAVIRFGLMMATVLAPEITFAWAYCQRRYVGNIYSNPKFREQGRPWTRTHAFYLLMGGFALYQGNDRYGALTSTNLEALLDRDLIDMPDLDKEEILDKSKGDWVAKTIAVVQMLWFTAQLIARYVKGWAVTELEVLTLSTIVMTVGTYVCWWDKPLDVRCQTKVYLKVTADAFFEAPELSRAVPIQDSHVKPSLFRRLFTNPEIVTEDNGAIPYRSSEWLYRNIFQSGFSLKKVAILLFLPLVFIFAILLTDDEGSRRADATEGSDISPSKPRDPEEQPSIGGNPPSIQTTPGRSQFRAWNDTVAMFNGLNSGTVDKRNRREEAYYASCAIFGALHFLAAWLVPKPTRSETILWQFAAIYLTSLPVAAGLTYIVADLIIGPTFGYSLSTSSVLWAPLSIGIFIHPVIRAIVVVDALALLRQLPDTAYRDLSWSDVIPSL